MKRFYLISILSIVWLTANSQSQSEMNEEAYKQLDSLENVLTATYNNILNDYKSDTAFIINLKNSQALWTEFRIVELEMKFPELDKRLYGSIYPLCRANYLYFLTLERINRLNQWLIFHPEGDCCSGSVKIRESGNEILPIERLDSKIWTRVLNNLEIIKEFKTSELSIRIITLENPSGSAGFENGEITHDIYFAISEFDEFPKQNLFSIGNLYSVKVESIDTSNSKIPSVEISFSVNGQREFLKLNLTIDKIYKANW